MATYRAVCVLYALLSLSYVLCEVEDLQPLIKSTDETLQKAKTHVDHMLGLSPIPHEDKLPGIVKNESEHLAYEIKKLSTTLQEKIAVGEHKAEIKEAVNAAVAQLNEAAETLHHAGSDLKQDNSKYYEAAEKLLVSTKNVLAAGPCHEISPVLKAALQELTHDVNNYQFGIHDIIGPHDGAPEGTGHHDSHSHHTHQHHGHSSEESNESKSSEQHDHAHHRHH